MRRIALLACLAVATALALPSAGHAVTNAQIPGLQVALKARGFYAEPIDGIAGPSATSASSSTGSRARSRAAGSAGSGVRFSGSAT
jgi:hypothetical protein